MIGMQRRRREPLFKEVVTIVRFRLAESCGRERGVKAARRALAGEDVKIARTVYEPSIHAVDVSIVIGNPGVSGGRRRGCRADVG